MIDDKKADPLSLHSAGSVADLPEPNPQEWEEHYDLQGNKLDNDKVREGKREEIEWILRHNLFHYVPEQESYERQGRPYTLKWVLRNKGNKVRARIVVRETKKAKAEDEKLEPNDVFSAMPLVESLKALVSRVMTERFDKLGRPLVLAVFDVSRAHFYGVCARDVYVQPPSELARPGFLAKLNKTMCGTQDASNVWQKTWGEQLQNNNFTLGSSNPSLFCSDLLKGFCHGDDFTVAAAEQEVERFNRILGEKFEVRRTGLNARHLDKKLEVLNRTVRIMNDEFMEVEADEKHVPQLLADLGLSKGNAVKIPRLKLSAAEAESIEMSPLLGGALATAYRSATMRAAYLGQDRVDISQMFLASNGSPKRRSPCTAQAVGAVLERSSAMHTEIPSPESRRSSSSSTRRQRLGRRPGHEKKHNRSASEKGITPAQAQQHSPSSDWTQLSREPRERAQRQGCKVTWQIGTPRRSWYSTLTLRAPKQWLQEEESARALTTSRRDYFGCRKEWRRSTLECRRFPQRRTQQTCSQRHFQKPG